MSRYGLLPAYVNIGRILKLIGIDIKQGRLSGVGNRLTLHVYAAEVAETGSSAENPYLPRDFDRENAIGIRKAIYTYYFHHLNFRGHRQEEASFYLLTDYIVGHAHNLLLQMAYDYGIIAGILFLGLHVYSFIRLIRRACRMPSDGSWCWTVFAFAVFFYGLTEVSLVPGMITWVLLYLGFYFAGENSAFIRPDV